MMALHEQQFNIQMSFIIDRCPLPLHLIVSIESIKFLMWLSKKLNPPLTDDVTLLSKEKELFSY